MLLGEGLYVEAEHAGEDGRERQREPDRALGRHDEVPSPRGETETDQPTEPELDHEQRADVVDLDRRIGNEDVDRERQRASKNQQVAEQMDLARSSGQ
jgi:hypothetical protein